MSNSWIIYRPSDIALIPSGRRAIEKDTLEKLHAQPTTQPHLSQKSRLQLVKSCQRLSSKPKLEYLRLQMETLTKRTERLFESPSTLRHIARLDTKAAQNVNTVSGPANLRLQARLTGQNSQKQVLKKQRNVDTIDHQSKQLNLNHNTQQQSSPDSSEKLQMTFNIDSTEPDEAYKEKITTPLNQSEYYCSYIPPSAKINKSALEVWKRRKMEREAKQKQAQYRTLIRSLSRQQGRQRQIIRNKMKTVIDELFNLQKAIKNS